jgi:hypothetical protein
MRSTAGRIGLLAVLAAVAVILFIVLSENEEDGTETTTAASTTAKTTTDAGTEPAGSAPRLITVRDGKPVGGVQELTYEKGDPVVLEIRLDQPAEAVHVHGYEIERPAETSPVRIDFVADIDGVFEVEVHSHELGDIEIAKLTVKP